MSDAPFEPISAEKSGVSICFVAAGTAESAVNTALTFAAFACGAAAACGPLAVAGAVGSVEVEPEAESVLVTTVVESVLDVEAGGVGLLRNIHTKKRRRISRIPIVVDLLESIQDKESGIGL